MSVLRAHSRVALVRRAAAIGAVLTMTFGGVAFADNVSNNLDGSVDATVEALAMTAGGSSTVTLYIDPTGQGPTPSDGKAGCNLTASSTLRLSVSSNAPTVASVSPGSITFGSCGDTKVLSLSALSVGTARISVAQTSNDTGGTFDLSPATFDVVVSPAPSTNTPPTVSVTGLTATAYPKGTVPTAGCLVQDAEDTGESAVPVVTGSLDADGLGARTVTCTYTDGGGLTRSASVDYTIVDPSAPQISYTLTPASPDGDNGWYQSGVTLTWTVTENESPNSVIKTGCVDQTITADQGATTYSCSATSSGGSAGPTSVSIKRDGNGPDVSYTSVSPAAPDGSNGWYKSPVIATFTATDGYSGPSSATGTTASTGDGSDVVLDSPEFSDNAGNTTGAGAAHSPAFKIDTTAPSVGSAVLSGTSGDNGWYTSAVTASYTATDDTSGFSTGSYVGSDTQTVSSSGEGQQPLTAPAFTDVAGNSAGGEDITVKVDTGLPTVTLTGGPTAGGSYYFGSVPGAPTCSASDAMSGITGDGTPGTPVACSVTGYGAGVGSHMITSTVTDRAGNSRTVTVSYEVLGWTTGGFYQPVDMNYVFNKVKGGSTVPLKFELFAGPTELTDTSAITSFKWGDVACDATAPNDAVEITTTGGTSLRYDSTGGQFIQNWKTPTAVGCYSASVLAQDGSKITAYFKITK
jgi:hypothetical protein